MYLMLHAHVIYTPIKFELDYTKFLFLDERIRTKESARHDK